MKEQIFLLERRIKVTNTRLMILNETYSMAGIISIKSDVIPGAKKEKTYTLIEKLRMILAPILFIGGFSQVCLIFNGWLSNIISLISLAFMCFVIYVMALAKDNPDKPPTYAISLRTASGELKALENKDKDFVDRVIKALNDAIVARG